MISLQKALAPILNLLICLLLLSFLPSYTHVSLLATPQGVAVVTFSIIGISEDVSPGAVVLTVDGVAYRVVDLPISFTWSINSMHSYQWVEYIPSITESKRYAWRSASGIVSAMGGVVLVPESGGVILAEYKTQYLWVVNAEGLGPDIFQAPVSVDGALIDADLLPFSYWWDENSQHVYCFEEFTLSTSGYKRYANHDAGCFNLTVTGPGVLSRLYHAEYRVYIWIGRGNGTTDPPPGEYWIDDGAHVYIRAIPEEGYTFEEWTDVYAECSTYEKYSNPTKLFICGQISLRANFREVKPFDFNVQVEPSSIYAYKGGSAIVGIVVLSEGEPLREVSLSILNIPRGVSYTFGTESVIPPSSTTLTITVSQEAQAGTYTLVLTATSGNITKNYILVLTILERERPWYEQPIVLAVVAAAILVVVLALTILRHRRSQARL